MFIYFCSKLTYLPNKVKIRNRKYKNEPFQLFTAFMC